MARKTKKRNRFKGVDVWRPSFGEVSVKAIYELYRITFQRDPSEMKGVTFRQIVDELRCLDNPDYKPVQLPLNRK